MLAAVHGLSAFLTVIGCVLLAGWVASQVLEDVQGIRRARRRRR